MTPALQLGGCRKSFGELTALTSIDLSVDEGEMFALVGPDGAGKTTMLRILAGVLRHDAGQVFVLGRELPAGHKEVRHQIGYLSQGFSLYRDLTVDENIAFFAEIYGLSHYDERREELLAFTRLTPFRTRLAGRLSGGMKKKLALACALIHKPTVILLDEPTTGVDPVSRRDFWIILGQLLHEGLTIVVATPYLDEAERCGRVGLLYQGRFLTVGTPDETKDLVHGRLFEVIGEHPRAMQKELRQADLPGVLEMQTYGDRVHIRLDESVDREQLEGALTDLGIRVSSIRETAPSLENVFISLVRKEREP